MAYNAAPIFYGDKAVASAMLDANVRAQGIGDSLSVNTNNTFARLLWAFAAVAPWGRVAAVDCSPRLLGADGAYNLNTSDISNQYGLCQEKFSMSGGSGASGTRDLPGLWAINADQATPNEGYRIGAAAADFAHYTINRDHPFGVNGTEGVATGANQEYFRQVFKIGSYFDAKSANKLVGAQGKLGLRWLSVHPSGGAAADNVSRRIVDVGQVAVGTGVTLNSHPTWRFNVNFWKPYLGALNQAGINPTFGGVLNAYRGDSADAQINAMGDFILANRDASNDFAVAIRGSSAIPAGRWLGAFGGVLYDLDASNDWVSGPQVGSWGTNSASYNDVGGTGTGKNVSEARLARALYMTALDLTQPLVFVYDFGDETTLLESRIQAMVETAHNAATTAGYTTIHHLLVTNHWRNTGAGTEDGSRADIEANRTAMRAVVDTLTATGKSVLNYSLYDSTDGVALNGGAAAVAYMAAYNAFAWGDGQVVDLTSGDLLDTGEGHPGGDDQCAWFATQMRDDMQALISGGPSAIPSRARKMLATGVL